MSDVAPLDTGAGAGMALAPTGEYRHVAASASRAVVGQIDIGVYQMP